MKYEKPEVRALVPAIDAIQATAGIKDGSRNLDFPQVKDSGVAAYQDWE